MGGHLLFLVDFIIAQNLEKVKFWKKGRREQGKKGGEGKEQGGKEKRAKQGEEGNRAK